VQVTSGGAYVLFDNQKGEMVSRAVSASALGGRSDARGEYSPSLDPSKSLTEVRNAARKEGDEFLLSNETVTVRVSKQGRIMSLVENATGRELIDEGKTAGFVLFEDRYVLLRLLRSTLADGEGKLDL
jgi:alpha-mannosidase